MNESSLIVGTHITKSNNISDNKLLWSNAISYDYEPRTLSTPM